MKYKIAICNDSRAYYEQYRSQTLFGDDVLPIKRGMEEMPSIDSEAEDRSPEGTVLTDKTNATEFLADCRIRNVDIGCSLCNMCGLATQCLPSLYTSVPL